jgi:hypothetical protein
MDGRVPFKSTLRRCRKTRATKNHEKNGITVNYDDDVFVILSDNYQFWYKAKQLPSAVYASINYRT